MKRTYVNRLPKDAEVLSTNARIENGEVIVEVYFKDEFKPKDGDFCVDYFGNTFILFEGGNLGINHGCYALFRKDGGEWYFQRNNMTRAVRFATPKEKAAFLERLEKECHKKWNEETKQLKDIRWRAEEGYQYWFVSTISTDTSIKLECNAPFDDERYNSGNYFKTKEAAQKVANQIKEIFKNSKVE